MAALRPVLQVNNNGHHPAPFTVEDLGRAIVGGNDAQAAAIIESGQVKVTALTRIAGFRILQFVAGRGMVKSLRALLAIYSGPQKLDHLCC